MAGFLGMPEYKGLVDAWHAGKERGDLVIGREGSAKLDVELSKPSPMADPDRETPQREPRESWLDVIGDVLTGGRTKREPETDEAEVEA